MRFSFLLKTAVLVTLVALFDRLFPYGFSGAGVGAFAGLWLIGLVLGRRDVRRSRRAWIALIVAVFVGSLFDNPGLLAWALFWCALSVAALLPKASHFDDAWRWGARLALHAATGIGRVIGDLRRFARPRCGKRVSAGAIMATLGLPLVGGALFIALFAAANPLIARALVAIRLPSAWQILVWAHAS